MMAHHQKSGLNCVPGGLDCGFSGQIYAECDVIVVRSILHFEMAIFLTFWMVTSLLGQCRGPVLDVDPTV